MLIRLKNASAVRRASVSLPYSKLKNAIGEVLLKEGWDSSDIETSLKEAGAGRGDFSIKNFKTGVIGFYSNSNPGNLAHSPFHYLPAEQD